MKLSDLRRFTIRQRARIRFPVGDGLECIVSETGICKLPQLNSLPNFDLEEQFAGAQRFVLERILSEGTKTRVQESVLSRDELAALAGSTSPAAAAQAHDHDE